MIYDYSLSGILDYKSTRNFAIIPHITIIYSCLTHGNWGVATDACNTLRQPPMASTILSIDACLHTPHTPHTFISQAVKFKNHQRNYPKINEKRNEERGKNTHRKQPKSK